jgi:precorrin-2/cobalt-factor-2 C20-methyltransferase
MPTLYGVGLGPGDPGLLTLKAKQVLESVGLVFAPKSAIQDEGLALSLMMKAVDLDPTKVRELVFPMTKDAAQLEAAWGAAAEAVGLGLDAGQDCAFVTLGDTAIYSTYMNFIAALKRRAPQAQVVTVPGISSFSAAAARLDLSLVEREERLAVLPCLGDVRALAPDLERFDTLVLMKVGRRFAALRDLLAEKGLLKHSHLFVRLGGQEELVSSDLAQVDPAAVTYMSLVLVRKPPRQGYE